MIIQGKNSQAYVLSSTIQDNNQDIYNPFYIENLDIKNYLNMSNNDSINEDIDEYISNKKNENILSLNMNKNYKLKIPDKKQRKRKKRIKSSKNDKILRVPSTFDKNSQYQSMKNINNFNTLISNKSYKKIKYDTNNASNINGYKQKRLINSASFKLNNTFKKKKSSLTYYIQGFNKDTNNNSINKGLQLGEGCSPLTIINFGKRNEGETINNSANLNSKNSNSNLIQYMNIPNILDNNININTNENNEIIIKSNRSFKKMINDATTNDATENNKKNIITKNEHSNTTPKNIFKINSQSTQIKNFKKVNDNVESPSNKKSDSIFSSFSNRFKNNKLRPNSDLQPIKLQKNKTVIESLLKSKNIICNNLNNEDIIRKDNICETNNIENSNQINTNSAIKLRTRPYTNLFSAYQTRNKYKSNSKINNNNFFYFSNSINKNTKENNVYTYKKNINFSCNNERNFINSNEKEDITFNKFIKNNKKETEFKSIYNTLMEINPDNHNLKYEKFRVGQFRIDLNKNKRIYYKKPINKFVGDNENFENEIKKFNRNIVSTRSVNNIFNNKKNLYQKYNVFNKDDKNKNEIDRLILVDRKDYLFYVQENELKFRINYINNNIYAGGRNDKNNLRLRYDPKNI